MEHRSVVVLRQSLGSTQQQSLDSGHRPEPITGQWTPARTNHWTVDTAQNQSLDSGYRPEPITGQWIPPRTNHWTVDTTQNQSLDSGYRPESVTGQRTPTSGRHWTVDGGTVAVIRYWTVGQWHCSKTATSALHSVSNVDTLQDWDELLPLDRSFSGRADPDSRAVIFICYK